MIVLLQGIPDYVFSSALSEFYFSTDAASARFRLTKGSEVILDENYVPDGNGQIVVYDLQRLIEPYLRTNLKETFSYTITDAFGSTQSGSFAAQYCAADVPMPASQFVQKYFLSTLMGQKNTSMGRKEFVHLVTDAAVDVVAYATYWSESDGLSSSEQTLASVSELGKVVTVDVSPNLLESTDKMLVSYVVMADARRMSFKVDNDCPDVAPSLVFTNSFGCQETFYCTGTQELDPQFTRSASLIGGKYRNYLIEENRVFSANTGFMPPEMAQWADELFRSREIYLMVDNIPGKEVTITESDSKRSNDYDAMPYFTFKYRYAQRNHNIIHLPRAGRVFDYTFDDTFE